MGFRSLWSINAADAVEQATQLKRLTMHVIFDVTRNFTSNGSKQRQNSTRDAALLRCFPTSEPYNASRTFTSHQNNVQLNISIGKVDK